MDRDNERGEMALDRFTAHQQIARADANLGLHHNTPHGPPEFLRQHAPGKGISDPQIARETGDKTVAVVNNNYANASETWTGAR